MSNSPSDQPPRRRRTFQFTLASMMLVTVLVSVLAALFGGLFNSGDDQDYKSRLVLLTLMVPIGLVLVVAAARLVLRGKKKRRGPRW